MATSSTTILPSISSTLVQHIPAIPAELLKARQARYYNNKVVLYFEEEFTTTKALEWVESYNLNPKNIIQVTLVASTPLALFVVQFDEENLAEAKEFLLAASPLEVREVFASVNAHTDQVDPCKQPGFKHLVTVSIPLGSHKIFNYLKFVVAQIGTYIKARVKQGPQYLHITVVVQTTVKIFPAQVLIQLQELEATTITFKYIEKHLRCFLCFSYRHLPTKCDRPKPAFLTLLNLIRVPHLQ